MAVVLLLAVLVWESRFAYHVVGTSRGLVRVNRLTGATAIMSPGVGAWESLERVGQRFDSIRVAQSRPNPFDDLALPDSITAHRR